MKKHSERQHAFLSASGSSKWLNCTPSAQLEDKYPDTVSSYAAEGTLAHEFAQIELMQEIDPTSSFKRKLNKLRASELYTSEMEDHVDSYAQYIFEAFINAQAESSGAILKIEDQIDLSHYIEEGTGINDAVIIADGVLEIVDLKYGKGVKVEAKENSQLMLYGLGALREHELGYDIKTVKLTIVQPRLDHISSWSIEAEELQKWGTETVIPTAKLAYAGEGELNPGDHCRWCKAKARCPALADHNMEVAKHDFKDPKELSDKQLLEIFAKQPMLVDWVKSVGEYLLSEALSGKAWKGYKLVEGRSNRKWKDEAKAINALLIKGFTEEHTMNTKIKGIGDIEKLVGKNNFTAIVGKHVIKPQGAPTLVSKDDKRPAMGDEQAKEDFK